jgi:hypothetical protein
MTVADAVVLLTSVAGVGSVDEAEEEGGAGREVL